MLVARSLWRELGLESILDGLAPKKTCAKSGGLLWQIDCWSQSRTWHCCGNGDRVTSLGSNGGATSRSIATSKQLPKVLGRSVRPALTHRKSNWARMMVTEVASEEPGVRAFVVQSEERLGYERAMREVAMKKTRQALDKLAPRVAAGRLKKAQKIGEAAARILSRNHGSR
jgi:hypothetical protein